MRTYFAARHIASARLDAEVLLSQALGVDRIHLYAHADQPVSHAERATLRALTKRRAAHEPIAYIRGSQEFYSRAFVVNADVLIPRPETEHVVEAVLTWIGADPHRSLRILDVGTGCGTLAVTLAAECRGAEVVATDISDAALATARTNAQAHGVQDRILFAQGDLFAAVPQDSAPFDVVVSNPPYVSLAQRPHLAADVVRFEPEAALFAGHDGLAILRRLCAEAFAYVRPQGLFATEIGFDQAERVGALLAAMPWDDVETRPDLQGLDRVVTGRRGTVPPHKRTTLKGPEDQRDTHGHDLDGAVAAAGDAAEGAPPR